MEINKGGEYVIWNCVLYKLKNRKELLAVPEGMQWGIIRRVLNRGHFESAKIQELIKQDFYVPRLIQQEKW